MDSLLIKICGIRTSEMAYAAGLAGADFIGVVFHPQSRRYVSQELAREIATAAIEAGAIRVAQSRDPRLRGDDKVSTLTQDWIPHAITYCSITQTPAKASLLTGITFNTPAHTDSVWPVGYHQPT